MAGKPKKPYDRFKDCKDKYRPNDHPALIAQWAREGFTNQEIAKKIGITATTLCKWQNKYEAVKDALAQGQPIADAKVEAALFKRAVGYEYEEVKETQEAVTKPKPDKKTATPEQLAAFLADPYVRDSAGEIVYRVIERVVTKKYRDGDVAAQIFWLINRIAQRWKRYGPDNFPNGEDAAGALSELATVINESREALNKAKAAAKAGKAEGDNAEDVGQEEEATTQAVEGSNV
jgi:hypothetical protein